MLTYMLKGILNHFNLQKTTSVCAFYTIFTRVFTIFKIVHKSVLSPACLLTLKFPFTHTSRRTKMNRITLLSGKIQIYPKSNTCTLETTWLRSAEWRGNYDLELRASGLELLPLLKSTA